MQTTQPLPASSAGSTMSKEEAKRVTDRLQNFYTAMKGYKAGGPRSAAKTTSGQFFTVDSATYLLEGSFNLLAVTTHDDRVDETITFEIIKPLDANNLVTEEHMGEAFWQTRDSLMVLYNSINYADKELGYLEISTTTNPGQDVTFTVTGKIGRALAYNLGCGPNFFGSHPANRAFAVVGSNGTGNHGYGWAEFNGSGSNIAVTNKTTTYGQYDAPWMIQLNLIKKFRGCFQGGQPCGYYTNVVNSPYREPAPISGVTAFNPGSTGGGNTSNIINFGGYDQYRALLNASCNGCNYDPNVNPYIIVDPQKDLKLYLSIPMMNHYISLGTTIITGYLQQNFGNSLYGLNVYSQHTATAGSYLDPFGSSFNAVQYKMIYQITTAAFIPYCGGGVGLPNL